MMKQIKQILLTAALLFINIAVFAQVKHNPAVMIAAPAPSISLKNFYTLAEQANVIFEYPQSFKEIRLPEQQHTSFDYAIGLPGTDLEIWFRIKSEKENWIAFNKNPQLPNPDSAYNAWGSATAAALSGDQKFFISGIPPDILARYNADAGKSYLLTLPDVPATKSYKYALLITLQKNHTGAIMAVCFTNDKGPTFFKNIDQASSCLKFKP